MLPLSINKWIVVGRNSCSLCGIDDTINGRIRIRGLHPILQIIKSIDHATTDSEVNDPSHDFAASVSPSDDSLDDFELPLVRFGLR